MTNASLYLFDEWVKFVFDHPASDPKWYMNENRDWGSPELVLRHITRLMNQPEILLGLYSPSQIEQGFWFIAGPIGRLCDWLWDDEIDWDVRRECIQSMANVFKQLFVHNPYEDVCYMWWDLFRPTESFERKPLTFSSERVENTMLGVLAEILQIQDREVQRAALHGLGHLRSTTRTAIIDAFLETHPAIDEELKNYALSARSGNVL